MFFCFIFAARNKQTTKFAFLHLKCLDMKNLLLSVDESLVLLDTLCLRRDFVSKLIATYDSNDDGKILDNYRQELRIINAVLSKLGYFQ